MPPRLSRSLLLGFLLAAGSAALPAPAAADPPPWAGHGEHRGREWREDRRGRERWERHEARRDRRRGHAAPAPVYAPPAHAPPPGYPPPPPGRFYAPPAYAPPPPPTPGIGVFIPLR